MIDLHMHLNGSLSAEIVIKLAKKHKIDLPTYDEEELKKLISVPLDCDSLNEYLKCTKLPRLVTQTKEGITDAVFMLLDELKKQGLIYAEIRFAPQRHRDNGFSQEEVVLAAIEGLKKSDSYLFEGYEQGKPVPQNPPTPAPNAAADNDLRKNFGLNPVNGK